jgi:3-oxoadipate enol-lactonase
LSRASVNGTTLAYELAGSGRTVVLIHGFSLDLRMWDEQARALHDRFRTLRYDQRGFGRSELPEVGVTYSPYLDLRALLSNLGITRADVIGLSAGGGVAIDFAIAYPECVQSLVLVDSALGGHHWSSDFSRNWDRIEEVGQAQGIDAARNLWLSDPLFAPARERSGISGRLAEMVGSYSGWHWVHESQTEPLKPLAARRLGMIRSPTLVLVGERDLPDFHSIALRLAREIPGAQLEIGKGAGHMLNMESPAWFNERVLRFLDSTASPDSAQEPITR